VLPAHLQSCSTTMRRGVPIANARSLTAAQFRDFTAQFRDFTALDSVSVIPLSSKGSFHVKTYVDYSSLLFLGW
jgi:hypothetical protein